MTNDNDDSMAEDAGSRPTSGTVGSGYHLSNGFSGVIGGFKGF